MASRSFSVSLTEVLLMLLLLEHLRFGESLVDGVNSKPNGNHREKREATPTQPLPERASCCVCGGAVYRATFIGKWNKTTHPNDYPETFARFSTVIGGTHNGAHVMWEMGTKASPAVKRFTEWGDTRSLLNKLSRKKYLGIIRIPFSKNNKPMSDRFRADRHHHYLSVISKISPSPDWFVGVDRFDLCNASDCSWKTNITIQLGPIDAGTDSGLKFMATNIKSQPTQPIRQIMPNFPNHPAASFYNREQKSVPPMAEFRINLVHTKGRCSRHTKSASSCVVSRWTSWQPCSVQCGLGKKTRGRVIIKQPKNGGEKCPKTLRTKSCRGRNCTAKVDCVMSSWSDWSACSKTCGRGRWTRERKVLVPSRNGGKSCPNVKLKSRSCKVKRCPVVNCRVSKWSSWSICSKSCGHGRRLRTRKKLQEPSRGGESCPHLKERQHCNVFACRGVSRLSSIGK